VATSSGRLEPVIERSQAPLLMEIYGAGFVAIFGVLALLYLHAYRKRAALELTARALEAAG